MASCNPMAAPSLSSTFKIATAWLVLGTLLFVGFQAYTSHEQRTRFSMAEGIITLERARDGHFHWPGRLSGVPVDFLVDTGATSTAIPAALARRASIATGGSVRSNTAGGTVTGTIGTADVELDGGVTAQRLRVAVLPDLKTPLLGMDVLSKLRITQEGQRMRIAAPAP
jgi:aspartyl protease family protein